MNASGAGGAPGRRRSPAVGLVAAAAIVLALAAVGYEVWHQYPHGASTVIKADRQAMKLQALKAMGAGRTGGAGSAVNPMGMGDRSSGSR